MLWESDSIGREGSSLLLQNYYWGTTGNAERPRVYWAGRAPGT